MCKLQHLALGGNSLKDAGIQAVADVLNNLEQLQYLCLGFNNLGDEGVKALAPALCKLRQLIILDIAANNIEEVDSSFLSALLHTDVTGCYGLINIASLRNVLEENKKRMELRPIFLALCAKAISKRHQGLKLPRELWGKIYKEFMPFVPQDRQPQQNQYQDFFINNPFFTGFLIMTVVGALAFLLLTVSKFTKISNITSFLQRRP